MNNRLEIAQEFAESINSDKIVKIILFGSVARGDDTDDSDIDILIISDYRDEIWDDVADMIGEFVLEKQELMQEKAKLYKELKELNEQKNQELENAKNVNKEFHFRVAIDTANGAKISAFPFSSLVDFPFIISTPSRYFGFAL